MAETATPVEAGGTTLPGVRVVTAAAVCLLAYSYLFGLWPSRHGYPADAIVAVRSWVNQPTGLGEDFGFLGTALLLMAAGHAIAGVDRWSVAARLLRRVVPAVVCAVAVGALLLLAGAEPLTDAAVTTPVAAVVLAVLLVVGLRPLERSAPWVAVLVQLEIICVLVMVGGWATDAGGPDVLRLLGLVAGLGPLIALGQVAWLVRAGRLTAAHGVGLGFVAVALLVVADRMAPELAGYWHPLGGVLALLVFLIALPRGAAIAATRPVRWLSSRAVPLYVFIPVVGYAVTGVLAQGVPLVLALLVGTLCAGAAAEGLHRGLEKVA
ncbi:hypothetical protein [Saccharothrix deserti]|uniref:hypothetical protein n=1 Tax=Saccharothrix deserti TaxID=2593674 RepID=UPI00131C02F8|nr:hypothetical protein [Saccharothrix deserti]